MLLREAGLASRRGAEEFIRAGRVRVNGRQASLGESADPSVDEVLLDGRALRLRQETVCYALNKPRGIVTTLSDPEGRPTVADFVAGLPWRLFPVGRLDRDSEGLLLFTNDGELANGLMHPRHHVPKTYVATLDQPVDSRLRSLILDEITLEDGPTRFLTADAPLGSTRVTVEIAEGRKRIVRRAFQALGRRVLRLERVAIGPLRLPELGTGQLLRLTEQQIALLSAAISHDPAGR